MTYIATGLVYANRKLVAMMRPRCSSTSNYAVSMHQESISAIAAG